MKKFTPSLMAFTLVTSTVTFSACNSFRTSKVHNVGQPQTTSIDAFTRSQLAVKETVEAKACTQFIGLWPIPIWWVKIKETKDFGSASNSYNAAKYKVNFFRSATRVARSAAKQRALQKAQGIDMVLSEKAFEEIKYTRWWKREVCSTVTIKPAVIKTDEQLSSAERMERPNTTNTINVTPSSGTIATKVISVLQGEE